VRGELRCEGAGAVIINVNGNAYAVNGMAGSRYLPIERIWSSATHPEADIGRIQPWIDPMRLVSLRGEGSSSMCKTFGIICATSTIGIAATSISVRLLHLPSPLTCQPMTSAHFFYLSDLSERGGNATALEISYLSPTTVSYVDLTHRWTPQRRKEPNMMRRLLLATFSLAATTLPLPAQTPNGPVQGAVQGTVKGTATVGQGVVQGTGQAGQGIAQGSASVARGAGQATVGVARGAGTVAAKTGKGTWCIITLGYGC
jgi:hypothetical protein